MSTLWTPSGERPVGRDDRPAAPAAPERRSREASDEQLAAEMAEAQRQLLAAPVSVVVANHCIGLFQLAALHLNQPEPDLEQASVAIDALAAIVEALGAAPRRRRGHAPRRAGAAPPRVRAGQEGGRGVIAAASQRPR